jgi:hypothetical protein
MSPRRSPRSLITALSTLALSLSAVACTRDTDATPLEAQVRALPVTVIQLGVARDIVTLNEGESALLQLVDRSVSIDAVRWSSDNAVIASVDARGVIAANTVGSTMITVGDAAHSTDILVTVLPRELQEGRDVRFK